MFNLNKHMDSDEKMLYFFRPSRRAYIHQYLFFTIVIVACIFFILYFRNNQWLMLAGAVVLLWPIYGIIRREWKIFASRYALTNERIFYSKGIFSEDFRSFHYYAITDLSLYQSLWDKIVNTGTISMNTSGTDSYEINFSKVADPLEIKRRINDLTPKKMHVGHMKTHSSEQTEVSSEGDGISVEHIKAHSINKHNKLN